MTVYKSTIFDPQSGQIIGTATHSGSASFSSPEQGEIAGAHFDTATHYVDLSGETPPPFVAERPTMPITVSTLSVPADGKTEATLDEVPTGATFMIDGNVSSVVSDGVVEFSAQHVGTYVLTFRLFPYLDFSVEITAT